MNVAFIPVRGGSKSIPLKNIKLVAGQPLVYWVVKAACACAEIDAVYVCTDSDVIRAAVAAFGFEKVKVIGRSAESATDTASTELGMLEFAKGRDFTNIVLIQATSPLITAGDLEKGLALQGRNGVDSVLSVVRQKRFIWSDSLGEYARPLNYDYQDRPRRQEFSGFLVENGAFYITSREALLETGCRLSGNIKTVEMPPETYLELDEPDDWEIVEALLRRRENFANIPKIKMFFTDCDGTLTDGGMYYSVDGEEMKKFNTRDGAALARLKECGIVTGIITGEVSEIVRRRAEKLNVDELLLGVTDKAAAISELCAKYGIDRKNVAYIGDDLNDVAAIQSVGLGICVADAAAEAKAAAEFITEAKGGQGAVREAVEFIIGGIHSRRRRVHRPWGTYTILGQGPRFKVKRLEIKPGASISLQRHHHRSEHWIVVGGLAEVARDDEVLLVDTNESTYIKAGHKHQVTNCGLIDLVIIEVQSGDYLAEDDIVRFDTID